MMKKIIIIAIIAVAAMTSCEDYLSKLPDNRTSLNSPDAIKELLVSAYPEGCFQSFCELMSDNVGDKGKGNRYIIDIPPAKNAYFWKDDDTTDEYDTPTDYWNVSYKAIAASNQALAAIEKNGNGPDYTTARGEALATRAYSHFMLANIFAKHYNPTTAATDLAVPYVDEPEEIVFKKYTRATLKDVYERVESELKEAESLIRDESYTVPKYHFTKDALNSLFSRFYLYKADWAKVIDYSSRVLGSNPAEKIRDWNGELSKLEVRELWAQYSKSEEPANIMLIRGNTPWAQVCILSRYSLSPKKISELFEQGDPLELTIGTKVVYAAGDNLLGFVPKYADRIEKTGLARGGRPNTIIPTFTGNENLFNRAEAYVMLGEYDKALADINLFMSKNGKSPNPVKEEELMYWYKENPGPALSPLYPIDDKQKIYLWAILDLRRRDFIHEGLRWFDVKRFDIEVVHDVFDGAEVKLSKGDLRRVIQIPTQAIAAGLTPNPR